MAGFEDFVIALDLKNLKYSVLILLFDSNFISCVLHYAEDPLMEKTSLW